MSELTLVGIAGSLRKESLNRKLLAEAARLMPSGVVLEVHDIRDIPLYNADLDGDDRPRVVTALKEAVAAADGVLLATPEYNYGIPGVLKNTIDWVSRPGYRSPFAGKPVAIIGASQSAIGTARAQGQLKQVLLGMLAEVFPYPEYLLASAAGRFSSDGRLNDDTSTKLLATMMEAFSDWVRQRRKDLDR